ncbi:MAG: UDP-N-acetylglucosamine 1-carboxyvinyltransferase, partial [Clostridia bacterium]|nr:UDP-N-acetylglucosamine 1-carboxyvinyltransferase [Clostridia bacterium]
MVRIKGTDSIFGEITLSGAKNAALPLVVGACLCSEPVTLHNMPVELNDLKVMMGVLRDIGFNIE